MRNGLHYKQPQWTFKPQHILVWVDKSQHHQPCVCERDALSLVLYCANSLVARSPKEISIYSSSPEENQSTVRRHSRIKDLFKNFKVNLKLYDRHQVQRWSAAQKTAVERRKEEEREVMRGVYLSVNICLPPWPVHSASPWYDCVYIGSVTMRLWAESKWWSRKIL